MTVGSVVYLCWYDFQKRTEHVCKGEVVDNSLYGGTQWEEWVNVRFQPPMLSGAIEHHFKEDQLSLTPDNVPHDDCYLVCATKSRAYERDYTVRRPATVPDGSPSGSTAANPSDAWKQVQQFKHDHWDYTHGYLSVDALDAYYQLWHDAIAAKRVFSVAPSVRVAPAPCTSAALSTSPNTHPVPQNETPQTTTPVASASGTKKPSRKELRSTGRIVFADSIQTSLFD